MKINKKPFSPNQNKTNLMDCGVGLNWYMPNDWKIKFIISKNIGKKSTLAANVKNLKGFIEVSKEY